MKIIKATNIQRTKNWRILIYGKAGLGKTTLIKNMQGKTLVLSLDNSSKVLAGTENVDIIDFDREHPTEFITEFLTQADNLIKNYVKRLFD